MEYRDPNFIIEFTCPYCAQDFTRTTEQLVAEPKFRCPAGCGLLLDGASYTAGLQDASESIARYAGDLGGHSE